MALTTFEIRQDILARLVITELGMLEKNGYRHVSFNEGYVLKHFYIASNSCIEICNDFRESLIYIYVCKLNKGLPPEALKRDSGGNLVRELYASLLMRRGIPASEILNASEDINHKAPAEVIIKTLLRQFMTLYVRYPRVFRDRPEILD